MQELLAQVHKVHRVILKEIQRICEKHKIRYFIESGTLLGAVRHQAAIPWDDDADCAMLRKDYERFRKIVRQELSDQFLYVEPKDLGGQAIFDFIPRVLYKNSRIHQDSPAEQYYGGGLCNHIGVDIFIIDDVHDNRWVHYITRGMLTFVYGLSMGHRYQLSMAEYKGISRLAVTVLARVGTWIPTKVILSWYDRISRLGRGKNSKKGRCYYSNFPIQDVRLIYQKKWFHKLTLLPLNEERFWAPADWEQVLTTIYGEYMQLPPLSERVIAHCQMEHVKIW